MVQLTTRRQPAVAPRGDIFDEMFRRLARFPTPMFETEYFAFAPAIEFTEADGSFLVTAELPGVKSEDIEVNVENNVLTVKGKKESKKEEKGEKYYVSERQYGEFERCFTLPQTIDASKINAEMKEGVLTVTLPKSKEAVGRKVAIKAG
jgi:HSP20 family protein